MDQKLLYKVCMDALERLESEYEKDKQNLLEKMNFSSVDDTEEIEIDIQRETYK